MKKIIYTFTVLLVALAMLTSLFSCETGDYTNGGSSDISGGNNSSDNGNGNTGNGSTDSGDNTSGGNGQGDDSSVHTHSDDDKNDYCDDCGDYLIVIVDFYAINDLHGKFCDSDSQPGVDELGTYFENREKEDDHIVLLSSGDMWQGSAESVLTEGKIMVDWMNELGFVAMTLGNHEFDWGEQVIKDNVLVAEFPFLAINVYDNYTGKLADYCTPSIIVERGDVQIGIIGAIGDCYSSISSDMVTDVNFKVGNELTNLVKAESQRLRALGVDIIVYSLHDGLDGGSSTFKHYDTALSRGYVDVVFEAHSHQSYIKTDTNGIIHIQAGGENYGLSHVEIAVNSVTGAKSVTEKNIVTNSSYAGLADHADTEAIEDKYSEIITYAYATLGNVSSYHSSDKVADYVAELYYEAGVEKWGGQYDIVLGGGFLQTRSPYNLSAGKATYADVLSLLPFNNKLVLCRVSGSKLLDRFIETTNSSYHIALKEGFGSSDIKATNVYYVVVDTYTALYKYNGLTIVDYYDETTYARDLLADAIKDGKLNDGGTTVPDEHYTVTPISTALGIGEGLAIGEETAEYLYYKGTVSNIINTTYGNFYLTDENGDQIYVYGLKDSYGNRYDSMSIKPVAGDVVIIRATVKKYQYSSGDTVIELVNSVVIAIDP